MTDQRRDPRVDDYLATLSPWQAELGERIRDLVLGLDPEMTETVKRRVQPYYVLQGNVCALLGTKDHLNLFVYDGGLAPDPAGIVTGGQDNTTARTVAFWQHDVVDLAALGDLLDHVVADNRAGGWRRIKAAREAAP